MSIQPLLHLHPIVTNFLHAFLYNAQLLFTSSCDLLVLRLDFVKHVLHPFFLVLGIAFSGSLQTLIILEPQFLLLPFGVLKDDA